jgi:endo-1,4-beta-xylanase
MRMGHRQFLAWAVALLGVATSSVAAATDALAAQPAALAAPAATAPAAAATAPAAVLTSDFEDGTTQGWAGRGSAAVAVSTAAAHGGTHSLLTTGRTATWNGPSRSVLGILQPRATYTVSAQVRLVAGAAAVPVHMTVQRTPAGGATVFERVASATASDAGWTQLTGDYSFQADPTDAQLYLESDDATVAFHLDDVTITMTAPPPGGPPDESGIASDFESGTAQGWTPRIGPEVLAVTGAAAHGGAHSLLTTNRTAVFTGPALNVLGRLSKGKSYDFSVWLRLAPGQAATQLRLSIERHLQGRTNFDTIVGNTTVTADAWAHLGARYTLGSDVDFLTVYAESATALASFYLDDFQMTFVKPLPIQTDIPSLRTVFAGAFSIGTAVNTSDIVGVHSQLLLQHFDQYTPGNALKWDATEPTEGTFTFADSDALVNFAVANGLRMRGHTLVWHQQTPAWVFQDAAGHPLTSSPTDRALLLKRLENHIRTVMGRYAGHLYAWDVANEVIDENQPDGMRRSPWFDITGLDYLRTAFRVAHEVDPKARLFINDYNTQLPRKRAALFNLVKRLRAEGVPVDGAGHQMHLNVEIPPVADIEQTIQAFASLGVSQEITELDMSVYTNFVDSMTTVPASLLTLQGYRYRDVFDALRRQRSHLSAVTVWGLGDDQTWLRGFPFPRLDDPLLFDDQLQAKPAFWGAVDPSRLPGLTRTVAVPAGRPEVDGGRDLQWNLLPDVRVSSRSGLAAGFQLRWDGRFLFVIAEVSDPTNDRMDAVDLFVDEGNSRTATYQAGDAHYQVRRDGTHTKGIRADAERIRAGYRVEAAIPLSAASAFGRQIGFDLRVRDASQPAQPTSWNDATNSQDTNPSRWGTLDLVQSVSRVDAVRGAPVIDGMQDPVWARARPITTAVHVVGTTGATATARLLWDDRHLYVLATVTDPTLDASSPNAFEQDSVEIFVDPNNGKGSGYSDDDGQYRVNFGNVQTIGGTFGAFAVSHNLRSATRIVPGGYVVEASIDLPTIRPREGALLGFDLQVNDAAGGRRIAATTWHDPTGLSFENTSRWGVARLVDAERD